MLNAIPNIPKPSNEPVTPFRPGSGPTRSLQAKVVEMANQTVEIPLVIGGEEIRTGNVGELRCPHDHSKVIARYHLPTEEHVARAVQAAEDARADWAAMEWPARMAISLKMADLLAGPWRDTLNASTMVGQSKTCHQAEIDSACELIDFLRFNPYFATTRIYSEQPDSASGIWNMLDHRPLDGFVLAISPFNFTSIAGNLPTAPAIMGNTVVWKPATTQVLSAWYLMQLFQEAGLPDGVINFLPGPGATVGGVALKHPGLAGVHFTGSTGTFQTIWQSVAENLASYRAYPRLVGETGGKDFIFVHPSADQDAVVAALVRGAFEYQGQKCSAASRAYIPTSMWPSLKEALLGELETVKIGDVADFSNYLGAVIDEKSYGKINGYIGQAREDANANIISGGGNPEGGWFIEPTVIETGDPRYLTMREEIFGPVLTVFAYEDSLYEETLAVCDDTSPYALTGAIFARDRQAIQTASRILRFAAGNFYINDKPTGAVVGQQPFGGSRASGTNDKAGSMLNLLRWVSPRTIKETFNPPTDYRYEWLG